MKKFSIFFFIFCFYFLLCHIEVHAVESEKGVYLIEQFPTNELLPLDGKWEFYWKKLYTPEDFKNNKVQSNITYITVPNGTSGFKLENGKTISKGYGTYRLRIKFPKEEIGTIKTLYLPSIASSYTLWVDGKKLESNGKVGTSKESMQPKYLSKTTIFPIISDTVELVIQVSNFNQRKAGIYTSIYLGENKPITQLREKN